MNVSFNLEYFFFGHLKNTLGVESFNPFVTEKSGIVKLKWVDFYSNKHNMGKYLWNAKIFIKLNKF